MNDKREEEVPLKWARRAGRAARRKPAPETAPPRIPRITRLMALAIKFQEMVDRGEVRDYADLARLGFVTRARLTQVMNLMLLAPDIQEEIMGLSQATGGMIVGERHIRSVVRFVLWERQRREWTDAGGVGKSL